MTVMQYFLLAYILFIHLSFISESRVDIQQETLRRLHQVRPRDESILQQPTELHLWQKTTQPWFSIDPRRITHNNEHLKHLKYRLRHPELKDLPRIIELKKQQGTQDVASCLETWFKMDPEGFLIAETKSGEIACVMAVLLHHENFYFSGLYYVPEKFRGLGIGQKTCFTAFERMDVKSNSGFNAVPGKMECFREGCRSPIVESEWKCVINETTEQVNPFALSDRSPEGVTILPFYQFQLPYVCKYDFSLHGNQRKLFLQLSMKEANSRTFVAYKDGSCVGFGIIRASCQNAARVGPLYADDPRVAEVLLKKLLLSQNNKGFAMMTTSNNTVANDLVRRIGCPRVKEYTRLYRRERLKVDTQRVYALFDFNTTPY